MPYASRVAVEEEIDAEWRSLVAAELSKSPRSAHRALREDRRLLQLQRQWEKEKAKEMQIKLERPLKLTS